MSSVTSEKPRRVFLVRVSVFEPAKDSGLVYDGPDFAAAVRLGVLNYLTSIGVDVRLASAVEITEGAQLAGVEPDESTPADIQAIVLPNIADLAEALRIAAGLTMALPEPRHLLALAASAEQWRARFHARLERPAERAIFDQAVAGSIAAAFSSIHREAAPDA